MTCDLCRAAQQDKYEGFKELNCEGIDMTDECRKMDKENLPSVPKLNRENERFVNGFFARVAPGLFTGQGGYDYNSIRLGFDVYGVHDATEKQLLMDKCLVIIAAHSEARRRKHGNA